MNWLGKLINREYIIEDNIQKGNTSNRYKKIKYVNKPYYLMTKTKLAPEKNILYYYCNNNNLFIKKLEDISS